MQININALNTHARSVECEISGTCYWLLNFLVLQSISISTSKEDSYQAREILYVISSN
jgi:hypothetical protein